MMYLVIKDTLIKYAQVVAGKYPPSLSNTFVSISGMNICSVNTISFTGNGPFSTGSKNVMHQLTAGDEINVCHTIGTCEYCIITLDALQNLILNKTDPGYRYKIDFEDEIVAFHNVAAKGIVVLVSGLSHLIEPAIKEMTGINWAGFDTVGEESNYVRYIHDIIHPFVSTLCGLLPISYFLTFCDKFSSIFITSFYSAVLRCKRIKESGTQQLLLDVYNLKTLILKLPIINKVPIIDKDNVRFPDKYITTSSNDPVMYKNSVIKQFQNVEILLKLVGTPSELLIEVFKVQWSGGTAIDLQTIMNLKGMKRNEQLLMLEKFGAISLN